MLPPPGELAARPADFEEALQTPRPATGSAEAGDLQRAVDLGHELANLDYGFRGIGKRIDEWHAKLQQT